MEELRIEKIASWEAFGEWSKENLHPIAELNWPEQYPDAPRVRFAVAHTGEEILLRFVVDEEYTLGRVARDNGPVWRDSCVEFFVSFDETGYYNFEFNCLGALLLCFGPEREGRTKAPDEALGLVARFPSPGTEPFGLRRGAGEWELSARIPAGAFFAHRITSFDGLRARANFYKCGDDLPRPHFLSWRPVRTPAPDFHRPDFFSALRFGPSNG